MESSSSGRITAGTALGGYKLLEEIGSGSCGTVYLAENLVSGERFALKTFPAKGSLAERELHAVRLFQKIDHPNLIRIHHVGQNGDLLFYTMDWCESSLSERKISPDELLPMAKKLTGALAELHKHGLIHRDIKPDNIFFRNGEIVLGDIGLVTRGETATFAGSPGFLAPALLRGQTGPNEYTDCYALAKTLYCALSGQDPGKYPYYDGELSEAASLILRSVMAVCGDEPEIHNTAELLRFLSGEAAAPAPRRNIRKYLWTAILSAAVLVLIPFLIRRTVPAPAVPAVPRETVPAVKQSEVKPEKKTPEKTAIPDFPKVRRSYSTLTREEYNRHLEAGNLREYASDMDRTGDWFEFLDWLKQHQADRSYREQYAAYSASVKDPAKREGSRKLHSALCTSGVGADTLSLYRNPERMELWQRAGIEWERSRKWKCLEELLRQEKAGTPPQEALRQMAKSDRFLQFFGVDQREWLNSGKEARLFRSRKNAKLQHEYRKATEKYVQQRDAFLDWFKKH